MLKTGEKSRSVSSLLSQNFIFLSFIETFFQKCINQSPNDILFFWWYKCYIFFYGYSFMSVVRKKIMFLVCVGLTLRTTRPCFTSVLPQSLCMRYFLTSSAQSSLLGFSSPPYWKPTPLTLALKLWKTYTTKAKVRSGFCVKFQSNIRLSQVLKYFDLDEILSSVHKPA